MPEVRCPIAEAAERWGDCLALCDAEQKYTYREYDRTVALIEHHLDRAEITPRDRVALALESGVEHALVLMALLRRAAIACPIDLRLPVAAAAEAVRTACCTRIIVAEADSMCQSPAGLPTIALGNLMGGSLPAQQHGHCLSTEQPATILFTSGSSGRPKAALHTFGNHYCSAQASNYNIELTPGDRWLLTLPLHHVSGQAILFRCLLAGAAVVFPQPGEALPQALSRCEATHVSVVPTQLYRLLRDPRAQTPLARLKAVLVGGSAVPPALVHEALARHLPIYTSYGLTEMTSQVTTTRRNDTAEALFTSGKPLAAARVTISPEGEILVRGNTLFAGYVAGVAVDRPLTPYGWFVTGDLGKWDPQGRLIVLGRKDSMFTSGGENVYPEEIERYLCQAPGVVQAVVVPLEDAEFGSRPVAFVKVASPAEWDPPAFAATLRQFLPRFKAPKTFLPWPEQPAEHAVKISRQALTQLARELMLRTGG